jgi:hypothetical protein
MEKKPLDTLLTLWFRSPRIVKPKKIGIDILKVEKTSANRIRLMIKCREGDISLSLDQGELAELLEKADYSAGFLDCSPFFRF